jgi:membrane-bound lytic murein transglycosylase F
MRDRAFGRPLACLHRRSLIGFAGLTLLLFSGCDQPIVVPRAPAKPGISVVVRPGPATWFIGPNGQATGFDHDLLTRFARERGVPLNVVFADGAAALLSKIGSGEAQLGAGGLFAAASRKADHANASPALAWSSGYHTVEPVLIYNVDG